MQVGSPLTPEDRILLQEVFDAATAIVDERERESYLDGVCAGRPGLRQTIEALLASDEELQARTQRGEALPLFGEYRGIRVIGRGGMGVVWLAERADGEFEKQVAVKLLSGWALSPAARDHFRRERQILASLEHPGVVRILDGGVQADGSPYLVMEYVDGEHIDVYCERERLSAEERRRLFTQVLDAVSYAHSQRVIHRDIKPSNILVDGTGRARLLDFGTARMVEPEGAAQSPQTVMRSFTPGYSCPELVSGKAVDARADIYSLGVLYGKLVGPVGSGVERRATAEDRKDRYGDAMEMRKAVLASGSRTAASLGRRSALIGVVMALVLAAAGYWAKPAPATIVLGQGVEREMSISADGDWVAFSQRGEEPGTSHLWLRPLNGKTAVQLTHDAARDRYPSLGPQGEFVVFESDRQPAGIYRLRTSGGGAKPELLIAGGHVPKVSPDGKHLLYLLNPIAVADAEAGGGGIAMQRVRRRSRRRIYRVMEG
ncbi:MAG: serine/threonine-protein kinase [Acidobacteria bacterium]|nr:serine/threonine-protein kinase [Acidobacteriota bacterium]